MQMQVVIESVKTGKNSKNGSPSRVITVEGGQVFRTAPDSQVAFKVENSEYRGVPVLLTLDMQDRVTHVDIVDE